jgi:hypothetical protein
MNMVTKKASNIFSGKNARILPAPVRSHHKKVPHNIGTYHYVQPPGKPTGNPATILYKKLPDDMILITGFENFKSIDDILDQYGRVIAITYNDYPSHMSGDVSGILLYGNNGKSSLRIGETCDKDEFSKIIAHVKKCGGLLHDIIQACDKGEVKRIEI